MIGAVYTLLTAATQRAWPIVISIIIANNIGHEDFKNFYEMNVLSNLILVALTQGYTVRYLKNPSDFNKDGIYLIYYLLAMLVVGFIGLLYMVDLISIKENYRLLEILSVISFSLLLSCAALFVSFKSGEMDNKSAFNYTFIFSIALIVLAIFVFYGKGDILYFYYCGSCVLLVFQFVLGYKLAVRLNFNFLKIKRKNNEIYLMLAVLLQLSSQYVSVKLSFSEKDGAVLASVLQFYALAIFIPGNLFSYFLPRLGQVKNIKSIYFLMSIGFSILSGIGYVIYSSLFNFNFEYPLAKYALLTSVLVFLAVIQAYENLIIISNNNYLKILLNAAVLVVINSVFVVIYRSGVGALLGLIIGYVITLLISRSVNV